MMQLRVGFEMTYECAQPTPMMLALSIHPLRAVDLVRPERLVTDPAVPTTSYLDLFGNRCSRLVAPRGRFVLSSDAVVNDSGAPDIVAPSAVQTAVEDLPPATLIYLLGSRFCETELLSDIAAEVLREVFEPFMQEPHAAAFNGAGLGLGLSVVRALVQTHGGSIVARSAGHGLGSQFVVTLPLAERGGFEGERGATAPPVRTTQSDVELSRCPGGAAKPPSSADRLAVAAVRSRTLGTHVAGGPRAAWFPNDNRHQNE